MENRKIINDIKMIALDMINNANSGHPGIVLGCASSLYTLYKEHLNFNVNDPSWINRDRFVLSAGHGSSLLYSLLFACGYNYKLEDLKAFRHINSITPGHPEYNLDLGIEMTTGPLGQGIATAVGMAMAEKHLESIFGKNLINYKIYVLCGDGDLMEGVSYEALSLASKYNLDNLIIMYDQNHITLDGALDKSFTENIDLRFKSLNFKILDVKNGENLSAIDNALLKAKSSKRPTIIKINNIIGRYSKYQNTNKVHGSPLEKEDLELIREKLTDNKLPFSYHENSYLELRNYLNKRCNLKYQRYLEEYQNLPNNKRILLDKLKEKENHFSLENLNFNNIDESKSLREINHDIMNIFSSSLPFLIGGSADTVSSTKTYLDNEKDFTKENYLGKNIYFGIREHASGAIINGLTLSGLNAFASTFLTFSDYMRPAIRNAALMNIPSIFIYTHDSITIGEDGPTHEPIEQLNSLRIIPNIMLYRPCSKNEIIGTYLDILKKKKPSIIALSRSSVNTKNSLIEEVSKGGYIIDKEKTKIDFIIVATGSEVELALKIKDKLNNPNIRIVSMPNLNQFIKEDIAYQEEILPSNKKIFALEYGNTLAWYKYTKYVIGINTFGASGKANDVVEKYKLDINSVINYIKENL